MSEAMIQALLDYYRLPEGSLGCATMASDGVSRDAGFFEFGTNNVCYGQCLSGVSVDVAGARQWDALKAVRRNGSTIQLPFNFSEVIENLRLEHYRKNTISGRRMVAASEPILSLYYLIRECLPVSVRRRLQRLYFRNWQELPFPSWPVDWTVDVLHKEFLGLLMETSGMKNVPFIWFWPEGAPNCLIMTHDVETLAGRRFTSKLMDLDDSYGFKASFQVVPEKRYEVPDEYVREIRSRGCEFNIHDLTHDGRLFQDRTEFLRRAAKINAYARRYDAKGFRAGSMYRNQDWYDSFEFSYDMSVPNVAHLEPMRGGCCTVMPYFIGSILELPLTTAEDYSLFHILNDYSLDLWKQQLALLTDRNGLMSFIAHPDNLIERRARYVYESLLDLLRQKVDRERIWAALPGEVDQWWRARSQMKLVQKGSRWEIEGPEAERARIAFAAIDGDRVVYEVAAPAVSQTLIPNCS
ncbi:MAG: hypothetical protein WA175_07025 [Candidatus Acidiferrales bacterium]